MRACKTAATPNAMAASVSESPYGFPTSWPEAVATTNTAHVITVAMIHGEANINGETDPLRGMMSLTSLVQDHFITILSIQSGESVVRELTSLMFKWKVVVGERWGMGAWGRYRELNSGSINSRVTVGLLRFRRITPKLAAKELVGGQAFAFIIYKSSSPQA